MYSLGLLAQATLMVAKRHTFPRLTHSGGPASGINTVLEGTIRCFTGCG